MSTKPAVETTSTATPVDALAPQHATSLNEWCAEVLSLRAIAKSFTAQADDVFDNKVVPLLTQLGINNSVAGAGWTAVRSKGRTTLNATKLVELGVPMKTIEDAKVTGKPSWGLRGKDDSANSESTEGVPQ